MLYKWTAHQSMYTCTVEPYNKTKLHNHCSKYWTKDRNFWMDTDRQRLKIWILRNLVNCPPSLTQLKKKPTHIQIAFLKSPPFKFKLISAVFKSEWHQFQPTPSRFLDVGISTKVDHFLAPISIRVMKKIPRSELDLCNNPHNYN